MVAAFNSTDAVAAPSAGLDEAASGISAAGVSGISAAGASGVSAAGASGVSDGLAEAPSGLESGVSAAAGSGPAATSGLGEAPEQPAPGPDGPRRRAEPEADVIAAALASAPPSYQLPNFDSVAGTYGPPPGESTPYSGIHPAEPVSSDVAAPPFAPIPVSGFGAPAASVEAPVSPAPPPVEEPLPPLPSRSPGAPAAAGARRGTRSPGLWSAPETPAQDVEPASASSSAPPAFAPPAVEPASSAPVVSRSRRWCIRSRCRAGPPSFLPLRSHRRPPSSDHRPPSLLRRPPTRCWRRSTGLSSMSCGALDGTGLVGAAGRPAGCRCVRRRRGGRSGERFGARHPFGERRGGRAGCPRHVHTHRVPHLHGPAAVDGRRLRVGRGSGRRAAGRR